MTRGEYLANEIERIALKQYALSGLKPSEWVEANIVMGQPFPGPYRYSKTPYCKEIIDCLAPDHPARWVAFMKGLSLIHI